MKIHQSNRTLLLCAEWREGDGLEPRLEQITDVKQQTHKSRQLSKQAQRALSLFLEGECKHPDLLGIQVVEVQYEHKQQCLCVKVGSIDIDAKGEAILAALKHSQSLLRSVVATSLHRKKIPALCFCYVGNSRTGGE